MKLWFSKKKRFALCFQHFHEMIYKGKLSAHWSVTVCRLKKDSKHKMLQTSQLLEPFLLFLAKYPHSHPMPLVSEAWLGHTNTIEIMLSLVLSIVICFSWIHMNKGRHVRRKVFNSDHFLSI